ncbi:hypothetical protein AWENTII_010183 [Aspergillus wentii]
MITREMHVKRVSRDGYSTVPVKSRSKVNRTDDNVKETSKERLEIASSMPGSGDAHPLRNIEQISNAKKLHSEVVVVSSQSSLGNTRSHNTPNAPNHKTKNQTDAIEN